MTKNATEASCGVAPRDRSHELYLVVVIFGVLTNCVVLARLAFRVRVHGSRTGGLKSGLYADDWAILATLLVGLSGTVFLAVGSVPNGVGRDLWTLTPAQITNFGMWFFASEVQYFISLATLKLSLLLFYLRIFPSLTVRRLLWATVVFDVLYGVAFTLAALLQCRPISFFWTNWDGEHKGYCANVNAVGWANAAISIGLDVWMLAVPLSQLRVLRLHWKKKVGVALMFFVGTLYVLISFIQLLSLIDNPRYCTHPCANQHASTTHSVTVVSIIRLQSLVNFANSANLTYDNWDVNLWSTLEVNTGIICACMPTIRQILAWYFPKVFGSGTRPGRYYPGRGDREVNSSYERAVQGRHHHQHHRNHNHHHHNHHLNNLGLKIHASRGLGSESRTGLTTWGDLSTLNSPSPTLKSGHTHLHMPSPSPSPSPAASTAPNYPLSPLRLSSSSPPPPPPPPPPRSLAPAPTGRRSSPKSSLDHDLRGLRVERSFYVDESSIECDEGQGTTSVPLETLQKRK